MNLGPAKTKNQTGMPHVSPSLRDVGVSTQRSRRVHKNRSSCETMMRPPQIAESADNAPKQAKARSHGHVSWALAVGPQPPHGPTTLHKIGPPVAHTVYVPEAPDAHWATPALLTVTPVVGAFC